MLKFPTLIRAIDTGHLLAESDERFFAEWVFTEWRERYTAVLLKAVRHVREMRARKGNSGIDSRWCNTAALILEIPGEAAADYFLRSERKIKDQLVAAVISDGGIHDEDGRWVELPLL